MREDLDLIIIGSGPGGYVAAIAAARLGLRTLVVEKDERLGGTCLHRGCIPTKALLHAAEILDEIRNASKLGITTSEPLLDLPRTHLYKQTIIDKNARGIESLFAKHGVDTIRGAARLVDPRTVAVVDGESSRQLSARYILLATGSSPLPLALAPTDGQRILNSDQMLALDAVPERLAILGGGAVGLEFASIFASFGSAVSVVEMLPRILPQEDEEVSAGLERILTRRGLDIRTGTQAESVDVEADAVRLRLRTASVTETLTVDQLLVAVGRRPCTADLGLETAGIAVERGFVQVDEMMRTSQSGVYAIGDIVATPQLAHLASAEGLVAVEHMAGLAPPPIDYEHVPSCTYCDPQVASVGLTEAAARQRHEAVESAKFPFTASGKAAILGRPQGFVKVVREAVDDAILGVHILGAQATELIAEACLALEIESTTEELFRTIHPHPTMSEAVMEAARSVAGRGVHG